MFICRPFLRAACAIAGCCGIVVAVTGTAHAQAAPAKLNEPERTLQASDAASPVPTLPYRSVFADLPRGVEEGSTDWKAANKAVAQFPRGHADLLQWEKARAAKGKERP